MLGTRTVGCFVCHVSLLKSRIFVSTKCGPCFVLFSWFRYPVCSVRFPGRSAAPRVLERYRSRTQEQAPLSRGLSRSMGSLSINDLLQGEDGISHYPPSEYHLGEFFPQQRGRPLEAERKPPSYRRDPGHYRKNWASSMDLAYFNLDTVRVGALEEARRGNSALSQKSGGRHKSSTRARDTRYSDYGAPQSQKPHHLSAPSVSSQLNSAYDQIKERQRKLRVLRQAMDAAEGE